MVTVVRGRPVSAKAVGSTLFNLAWSCACSFQPAQSWPGWQQEKMGKGRGEGCSHLWEHRLHLNHWGLLVCSVRCMLGAGWGSVRHGWNGPTKTAPGCLYVRFFNICFCCPRFLILAVDVALWTCAVHPMKSCYGRGKDVYKINCQAFPMLLSLPPHHLLCCFFFQLSEREWSARVTASKGSTDLGASLWFEHRNPHSWRMWAHRSTSTCPLVNVAKHAPSTRPTVVAVLTPAVAEHQRWTGLAGVAVFALLYCISVLQQNIKDSILVTKYVSLRIPRPFLKGKWSGLCCLKEPSKLCCVASFPGWTPWEKIFLNLGHNWGVENTF